MSVSSEVDFNAGPITLSKLRDIDINDKKKPDRVVYARKGDDFSSDVNDGTPITLQEASDLKEAVWGSATVPVKVDWMKQGIVFHPYEKAFAYGLKTPKNNNPTKNLLMCLQAYFLKQLLFDKKTKGQRRHLASSNVSEGLNTCAAAKTAAAASATGDNAAKNRHSFKQKSSPQTLKRGGSLHSRLEKSEKAAKTPTNRNQVLRPNEKQQLDMLVGGLADLLFKLSEGNEATFCVPGSKNNFEPSAHYTIDGITEKLYVIRCPTEDDMRNMIRKYSPMLQQEKGCGVVCVLYSLVLSRGRDRLQADLQDQSFNALVDAMGDPQMALLTLIVTGRATPYLHNGTITPQGESVERVGIENRNDLGLLVWEHDESSTAAYNLGSRLKTPDLPIWVTKVNGHVGILFNPNKELTRSYHVENRFQLYYYSDCEARKEDHKDTVLTIDTRNLRSTSVGDDSDLADVEKGAAPPLECAIRTKWSECEIDWQDISPYV